MEKQFSDATEDEPRKNPLLTWYSTVGTLFTFNDTSSATTNKGYYRFNNLHTYARILLRTQIYHVSANGASLEMLELNR